MPMTIGLAGPRSNIAGRLEVCATRREDVSVGTSQTGGEAGGASGSATVAGSNGARVSVLRRIEPRVHEERLGGDRSIGDPYRNRDRVAGTQRPVATVGDSERLDPLSVEVDRPAVGLGDLVAHLGSGELDDQRPRARLRVERVRGGQLVPLRQRRAVDCVLPVAERVTVGAD